MTDKTLAEDKLFDSVYEIMEKGYQMGKGGRIVSEKDFVEAVKEEVIYLVSYLNSLKKEYE